MKIAVVSSRDYPYLKRVREYVKGLPKDTIVVSGGARGVDRAAEIAAITSGLSRIIIRAEWEQLGRGAGFARNQQIVDEADEVVAF